MRGGANAHLMLADGEQYYIAKCRNNSQHPRVLVSELVQSVRPSLGLQDGLKPFERTSKAGCPVLCPSVL